MNTPQQPAKTSEEIAEEHKYDNWWLGGKKRKRKTKSKKMKSKRKNKSKSKRKNKKTKKSFYK